MREGISDTYPGVKLAVTAQFAVIALLMIHSAQLVISSPNDAPLVLLFLHDKARATTDAVIAPRAPVARRRVVEPPEPATNAPPVTTPPAPNLDWQREAELAAQSALDEAERRSKYRDLSALSAEQLSWAKRNHMAAAPPGIAWTHPRFEFDRYSGLPIFWINDHCVLVTLMVFCAIGKIEASGDLFRHMRDP